MKKLLGAIVLFVFVFILILKLYFYFVCLFVYFLGARVLFCLFVLRFDRLLVWFFIFGWKRNFICLNFFIAYTITPRMKGVYSIAEAVDDSNKRPQKTIFIILKDDGKYHFSEGQLKSLNAVAKMIRLNNGQVFDNLKSAAKWITEQNIPSQNNQELTV